MRNVHTHRWIAGTRVTVAAVCALAVWAARSQIAVAQTVTLTVSVSGSGSVHSVPSGIDCPGDCSESYLLATLVTLTAEPDPGQSLIGWEGCDLVVGDACEVTMTANRSVRANFTEDEEEPPPETFTLTVSRNPTSGGTVTSSPGGIDCGTDCSEEYEDGTSVTLTATAASGWDFSGWSGACSGTGSCTVEMTADRSVTANFTEEPPENFTLTVSFDPDGDGTGTVTSSPAGISCSPDCAASFPSGTEVALTADPAANSAFIGWSGACTGTGDCSVVMTTDRAVTAEFRLGGEITVDAIVDQLLYGSSTLTEEQLQSLDESGNQNGHFDLGDFRAYLMRDGNP